jgi:hypothetical protein
MDGPNGQVNEATDVGEKRGIRIPLGILLAVLLFSFPCISRIPRFLFRRAPQVAFSAVVAHVVGLNPATCHAPGVFQNLAL